MKLQTTRLLSAVVLGLAFIMAGCQILQSGNQSSVLKPPVAKIEPYRLEKHGDVRIDNYYWLKERENPAVIRYLEAENAYT